MLSTADWVPCGTNKWEIDEGLGILGDLHLLAAILLPAEVHSSVVVGPAPGQTYDTGLRPGATF